jgi:hypothetical protein
MTKKVRIIIDKRADGSVGYRAEGYKDNDDDASMAAYSIYSIAKNQVPPTDPAGWQKAFSTRLTMYKQPGLRETLYAIALDAGLLEIEEHPSGVGMHMHMSKDMVKLCTALTSVKSSAEA